jgi:hypothetical protein
MGVIKYKASEYEITRLKNVSGSEMYFDFIPPHGKTLSAGEEVTLIGDLSTILSSDEGKYRKAKIESYLEAVQSGYITASEEETSAVSSSSSSEVSSSSSSS